MPTLWNKKNCVEWKSRGSKQSWKDKKTLMMNSTMMRK